jgi:hypothetical protein
MLWSFFRFLYVGPFCLTLVVGIQAAFEGHAVIAAEHTMGYW